MTSGTCEIYGIQPATVHSALETQLARAILSGEAREGDPGAGLQGRWPEGVWRRVRDRSSKKHSRRQYSGTEAEEKAGDSSEPPAAAAE
jgi:hypothetical protein